MRMIVVVVLFLFIMFANSSYIYAQNNQVYSDDAVNSASSGSMVPYDEEMKEFYDAGIGLLLDEGQEILLKDLEDNSKVLRGGEAYTSQSSSTVDIDEAFQFYAEKKYDEAFRRMLEIARMGNADAQEAVAVMLFNGWGTPKDMKQAVRWFEQASRKLRPLSLHYLGTMYFQGAGVKKDMIEAAKFLSLAVKFYGDNTEAKKRATEDLENVLARISLREQRSVQSKIEEWINKHSAAVSAFERRQKMKKIIEERNRVAREKRLKGHDGIEGDRQ